MNNQNSSHKIKLALIVGALGVVYGDIGTSPLYAMKEAFFGFIQLDRNLDNVLGVLSLFFWTLMIIVTVKYISLIMRADNNGEGGIFSLLALIRQGKIKKTILAVVGTIITIGAVLLYGDGIITPSISVLSAMEGLNIITSNAEPFIVPITILILFGLFYLQKRGSGKVGSFFGPIMMIWFATLIALGIPPILKNPEVLQALNPLHAILFIKNIGFNSFIILGAVVLCVTGAEALYADMGHFGRRSISLAWFTLVYPALIINYFGQGAKLLSGDIIPNNNLFYSLAPEWGLWIIVILSTAATIIASQALISGVFSLTNQAIALGLFPKIKTIHTNPDVEGQIYLPAINWLMFFGCAILVLTFKSSGALAAAYGIAVTGTMVITTLGFFFLAYYRWHWKLLYLLPICLILIVVDLAFFFSNALKIAHGGWVPLLIAAGVFSIMHTWEWGRGKVTNAYAELPGLTVSEMIAQKENDKLPTLNRSIVVLSSRPILSKRDRVPVALDSFCHKWGLSIPKHVIFMNVVTTNTPRVSRDHRYEVTDIFQDEIYGTVTSVQVFYGYTQIPNLRRVIEKLKEERLVKVPADPEKWLILTSNLRLVSKQHKFINQVRMMLFGWIIKFSKPTYSYVGLGKDPNVAIETINI